ncbi:8166_t:CDS:2 [Diversispora eburnea]|uniref:8166_t:CDS:1 n=1 Tax=Diversispora eburnea TaxID=1213867 RepID=A0A9N8YVI7_9GLOM|nr:8166_t:CDS:2 [Diversispora eburnea]
MDLFTFTNSQARLLTELIGAQKRLENLSIGANINIDGIDELDSLFLASSFTQQVVFISDIPIFNYCTKITELTLPNLLRWCCKGGGNKKFNVKNVEQAFTLSDEHFKAIEEYRGSI